MRLQCPLPGKLAGVYCAAVMLLAIAGCELAGSSPDITADTGVTARTDRGTYSVQDTIRFTISNESSETIRVSSDCTGLNYELDRRARSKWVEIRSNPPAICPAIFAPNTTLKPGEHTTGHMVPGATGDLRLRFDVGVKQTEPAGAFNTASNPFQVTGRPDRTQTH